MGNITELKELNYAGAKVVCDKISFSKGTQQKYKTCIGNLAGRTGKEIPIRLDAKEWKTCENMMGLKHQNKTANKPM